MKKITFLFLCLLITSAGFAQVNLVDFETLPPESLDGFENIGGANIVPNPFVDANNGSATVGELIVSAAGAPWQGANVIFQDSYIDVSDPITNTVTVDVYADAPFTMLARLADGQSGATDSAADVAHTGSGWEELTFTFNESLDGTGPANGEYARIAFFPNWNGGGWNDPAIARTVYIDNITGFEGAAIVQPTPPSGPPTTPPNRPVQDVLSVYSDAYTNVATDQRQSFGGSIVTDIDYSGNSIISATTPGLGAGFQYQYFSAPLDITDFDFAHIDFYVSQQAVIEGSVFIFIVQKLDGTNIQRTFDARNLTPNTWNEMDMNFSEFAPAVARNDISQVIVQIAGPEVFGPFYVDNIYFHKNTLGVDDFSTSNFKVYPNPSSDRWNVSSNAVVNSVAVYDILGKQVISLSPNTTEVAIDASSLTPGMYFAEIKGVSGSKTVKLIKE